ncbi:MAG: hypothetical protein AB7P04_11785 [Bacteriovoracia bacterium]
MNFSEFLRERRGKQNFQSVSELYQWYGGEKKLGISFRQFQNVESGKQAPTPKLLSAIFNHEPAASRHVLIQAYFSSHLADDASSAPLQKYLAKNLTQSLEEGRFEWDARDHRSYSEAQLDFLTQTPDAMRFYRRLILVERVPKQEIKLSRKLLAQMADLELIEVDDKYIRPSSVLYRLPKFGSSNPRIVSKAHEFILNQVTLYMSKEGSERQEISYAFQLVQPEIARAAREQLRLLKQWVQSHVVLKTPSQDPRLVPLLFVGVCKELESHEILNEGS